MKVTVGTRIGPATKSETLGIGLFEEDCASPRFRGPIDGAARAALAGLVRAGDFRGRAHEIAVVHPARPPASRLLVVGLGSRVRFSCDRARVAMAALTRRARDLEVGALRVVRFSADAVPIEALAQAMAEGAVLGHYRFDRYRSGRAPRAIARVELADRQTPPAILRDAASRGARWASGVCLARDLASTPGQDLTPAGLAAAACEVGRRTGARVQVMGVRELEKLGMGALLGVGRGSDQPPCFIVLERAGARPGAARPAGSRARSARAVAPAVLVGKGVTFDTGGISLKPHDGMSRMKYDMSGAAAVLGVFEALPSLELPFPVVGLIPSAENMPGGRALKPGDVLTAMDGTTIEVTNTDAEGRLILADALCYAKRLRPAAVVDLATLTGAVSIALGHLAAGLFTRDEPLAAELERASAASGERLWRLPLWEEYASELRSDTADLVNSATREGAAILGATFLAHFARGLRWAHLDIASTAWTYADRPDEPRGPNGFGVRLLLEWLSRRAAVEP